MRCRNQQGEGSTTHQMVRTWVQIQAYPRRQKGSLITSQWDILVTAILGVKPKWFREWYGSTVLYESI
jgi:uncharacterized membrane protein YbaN (DUF454 family)